MPQTRRARRVWRIAAGAVLLAFLIVGAVLWLSVLREVRAPITSADGAKAGRPSAGSVPS